MSFTTFVQLDRPGLSPEIFVKGGQIVKMDVWNDSAERILVQRGIEA